MTKEGWNKPGDYRPTPQEEFGGVAAQAFFSPEHLEAMQEAANAGRDPLRALTDGRSGRPMTNPGLKNKNHPCVLRGSATGFPYMQVALLHDVPYAWVLQFADRIEADIWEELPHKLTWEGWQLETYLVFKKQMRDR